MDNIESHESSLSIVGSGFDMPIDMLMRKQETTCMYEDPDAVENYHRKTLKDLNCDKPLFESDLPRGGVDEYGNAFGNNYSQQSLELRETGHRNAQGAEPYLPDGTFLDWQFLEQDPRGVALEPDMKRHVNQQYARGSYIMQYPDNDDSVPESGINPYDMNRNIRNGQNIFKDYYKNFETSFDGWHNGGMAPGYAVSIKEQTINGEEIKDPAQADNRNRMDVTNNLSNDTSIGWRRTTDHRFNVAKYGRVTEGKSYTDEDWYKNRGTSSIDHDIQVSWQDMNLPKTLALKMMDLSKNRVDLIQNGLHGIAYGVGRYSRSTKHKLTPADMAGMKARSTKETRDKDSIENFQNNKTGQLPTIDLKQNCVVDIDIIEKIIQANKETVKGVKDDLRRQISVDIKDSINKENIERNKKNIVKNNNWDSLNIFTKGTSKEIINYKKLIEKQNSKKDKVEQFIFDDSHQREQMERTQIKRQTHMYDTDNTHEYGTEGTFTRHIGGLGNKINTRTMHNTSNEANMMNDR